MRWDNRIRNAFWRSANADREADFRFQLNDSDIVLWKPTTSRIQDNQLLSGFAKVESISGTNSIDFDFKVGGSNTTIYVRDARMYILRAS